MKRYLFLASYGGDPTQGFDFAPEPPFDKVELVQPGTAPLYPDPGDAVLVSVECQRHTMLLLAQTPLEVDGMPAPPPDPGLALAIAAIEQDMNLALSMMGAEYTYIGEVEYE